MISEIKRLAMRLLQEEVIVASWGITDVEIEDTNLHFHVDGFKFCGLVKISVTDTGNYVVQLGDHFHGEQTIDSIVDFLDNAIEKTDSYNQDLEMWLNKSTHV